MMCACNGLGYIKVALPQGVPFRDRATKFCICLECNGVDSKLESSLKPVGMTVQQYFQRI
jgi:hypothetical protein